VVRLPEKVRIVEVGPRDGLQNEARPLDRHSKIEFIQALARAGLADIEVGSFVRPELVPQLADSDEIFVRLEKREGCRYWVLVPNERGLERAKAVGATHVAAFVAATDGFSRANVNATVEESLARIKPVIRDARDSGMTVRGYVSTVFGCPYEGRVEPRMAARVSRTLLDSGCDEVSLGDTVGVAVPADVDRVIAAHDDLGVDRARIGLHFHDTRGTALANVYAGLLQGVTTYDSSAGGLGGCPFAPGAAGNLATEDLVYLLNGLGIECGVSLERVAAASGRVGELLGRALPSRARAAFEASRRSSVRRV
jgi:hydroxymethylglutaryl-CoA lyase